MTQIHGDRLGGLPAVHGRKFQGFGNIADIGHDVAFDPGMNGAVAFEDEIKLFPAKFRDQRQAEECAAKAVIFAVEKIAHRWRHWTIARLAASLALTTPANWGMR